MSNSYYKFVKEKFPEQYERMQKFGRRNVSVSTVAPTGSVSILAACTSGIEPLFMPFHIRRKKVASAEDRVDFVDNNGDKWTEFPVLHPKFKDWCELQEDVLYNIDEENSNIKVGELSKDQLTYLFEMSPWYKSTANDIDWIKRVRVQSTIQKYISHSISSTVNLPKDVSEEEVSRIYIEAWKQGLKGITVYVEDSRSGVLVSSKTNEKLDKFRYSNNRIERPTELQSYAHTTNVSGEVYTVIVGVMDGNPYEVFVFTGYTKEGGGKTVKQGSNDYYFIGEQENAKKRLFSDKITEIERLYTKGISAQLQHGRAPKYIVKDADKESMFGFARAVTRVLKKYIKDGEAGTALCNNENCTGDRTNVVFQEGCQVCLDCGNSKCG